MFLKYIFCCCRRKEDIDIDASIDWADYNITYVPPSDKDYKL